MANVIKLRLVSAAKTREEIRKERKRIREVVFVPCGRGVLCDAVQETPTRQNELIVF